jgi:hypothetical protein
MKINGERKTAFVSVPIRGEQGGAEDKRAIFATLEEEDYDVLNAYAKTATRYHNNPFGLPKGYIANEVFTQVADADFYLAYLTLRSEGVVAELTWRLAKRHHAVAICRSDRLSQITTVIAGFNFPGDTLKLREYNQTNELPEIIREELKEI